ncbi:MAG: winged helix DNA-binding domain-containing protein [Verrucomicrobiae bacterium]|nr:winged helix DNA-binding domain-containing protein [Verrucomicrobiae bacterium]
MSDARPITQAVARRFMRRATGLDAPFTGVGDALQHLGYVQIDPINVCGRMQDLILRNRVAAYREEGLMHFLHGRDETLNADQRTAFEHHLPGSNILVAMPLEAWPHLQGEMRKRRKDDGAWSGKLTAAEKKLASRILAQMKEQGALSSQEIDDGGKRSVHVWGSSATLAKATLQKLFFHGRVLIAQRQGNRRYYDLPERVIPAATLSAPAAKTEETQRWLALNKLRQRRLCTLTTKEHRLLEDKVLPVTPGDARIPRLFILKADEAMLETSESESKPLLLAPLDPLLYDRKVTEAVWAYHYRWEVYTPPQKRVRGYYALPLLSGIEIVGHVDTKADRAKAKLGIVSKQVCRGHSATAAVRELAQFLGLN